METPIILIQGGPSQQTGAGLVQSQGGDLRGVASPRVQLSMFLSAVRGRVPAGRSKRERKRSKDTRSALLAAKL